MNSFPSLKFALLVSFILAACTTIHPPQIPTPTISSPSPTPDLGIITPENIDRLVQVKQIGMGIALGSPQYSPDGNLLYQATTTGVFVFDTNSPQNNRLLASYPITYSFEKRIMDLSPDGKLVAIGNDLIDTKSGSKLPELEFPMGLSAWPYVSEVKFSPEGSLIARVYDDVQIGEPSFVGLWRIADGKLLNT